MIDEKKLTEILSKNSIFEKITNAEGKNIFEIIDEQPKTAWIPCEERLPNKEEYNKSNGQFIVSDGNRTYATYFDIYDTFKFGEPTIDHFKIDKCVIAWQPLPTPYKKEGAE